MQRRSFLQTVARAAALLLAPATARALPPAPATPRETAVIHSRPGADARTPAEAAGPSEAAAVADSPAPSAATPARRPILLQTSPVAGFQYHDGEFAWPFLRPGDRLALIREPENRHDGRAVRIEWEGLKLGYLPRHENHAVAQLLDRDEQLHARILALRESSDPWERVQVAVELVA
ncbi:MAG: HIRAN domain-containing protein [Pseudomonadota bacterium]